MDQAAKTEILESIETALVLLKRLDEGDDPGHRGRDISLARRDIEKLQERLNELLDEVERRLSRFSRAQSRGMQVFDSDLDDSDLYEWIGLLRILKPKTGGASEIKLYWEGLDQRPTTIGTYSVTPEIEDIEVEAMELLLEDRRNNADWARDTRAAQQP